MIMNDVSKLITRAQGLVDRLEQLLPGQPSLTDWNASTAFRWRRREHTKTIDPVVNVHRIDLRALRGIDEQKQRVEENTRQFVDGFPANNVLLTGARGIRQVVPISVMCRVLHRPRGLVSERSSGGVPTALLESGNGTTWPSRKA